MISAPDSRSSSMICFAGRFFLQRLECALRIVVRHVRRLAVEDAAHLHDRAGRRDG